MKTIDRQDIDMGQPSTLEATPDITETLAGYSFPLGNIPLGDEAKYQVTDETAYRLLASDREVFDTLCDGAPRLFEADNGAFVLTRNERYDNDNKTKLFVARSILAANHHLRRVRGRVVPTKQAVSVIDPEDGNLFAVSHVFVSGGLLHSVELDIRPTKAGERNQFHHLKRLLGN